MKRVVKVLLIVVVVFLIVSYFIPVTREKQVFVGNTFENIITSVTRPENWVKWYPPVSAAWLQDSAACHFSVDTASHVINITIPGRTIRITPINYLLYQLEETRDGHQSVFGFSITPYVGNGQPRSQHNTTILYAQKNSLFSKIFPFPQGETFADQTIKGLDSYLEDYTRFYGFPIELKPATEIFFLTKKADLLKPDVFKTIPLLFGDLDRFALEKHCKAVNRNISFVNLSPDSVSVMAGVNIDSLITGDYLHNSVQLPPGEILAVAHFEGPFRNRPAAYRAMEKYMTDHQLIKGSAAYEKYLSPLPDSDSAIVKIELSYPLRF